MSHNPTYRSYPFTQNPKSIEAGIATMVEHECYQEGGSLVPIKWMDKKIFNSYDEAYDYLERTDNGWYDNRAVVYLDTEKAMRNVKSKKLEDLRKRIDDWEMRRNTIVCTYHFANAKSALISCKNCGSKIANGYMQKRNNCPVCSASMLPPTTLKQLDRANEMIKKLNSEYDNEKAILNNKLLNKAEKKWLVYFDYHT